MAYRLCNGDPPGAVPVRYLTCVLFLPDGVCAAVPGLLRHAAEVLVAPGGRLLVSHYQPDGGTDRTAAEHLRALGFPVAGQSAGTGAGRAATTAWLAVPA